MSLIAAIVQASEDKSFENIYLVRGVADVR
jgi:hypothetical protein